MAKRSDSLEEGLEHSANKRGLTGKERHRYIGGALHNLGKSKPRHKGDEKKPRAALSKNPYKPPRGARYDKEAFKKHGAYLPLGDEEVKPSSTAPKRKPYSSPTITKREHLTLVARMNPEASKGKAYNVYSIYKSGSKTPHTSQQFRKLSAAKAEAKILMDESKEGLTRRKF